VSGHCGQVLLPRELLAATVKLLGEAQLVPAEAPQLAADFEHEPQAAPVG
jgi:hypothetical protein